MNMVTIFQIMINIDKYWLNSLNAESFRIAKLVQGTPFKIYEKFMTCDGKRGLFPATLLTGGARQEPLLPVDCSSGGENWNWKEPLGLRKSCCEELVHFLDPLVMTNIALWIVTFQWYVKLPEGIAVEPYPLMNVHQNTLERSTFFFWAEKLTFFRLGHFQ